MKTLGDYIVLLISIFGSFASICAYVHFLSEYLNTQGWVGVAFTGLFSLIFLIYNFYLISKYRKRIRYCEIFEELNSGFSNLHNLDKDEKLTSEVIIEKLIHLCNSISNSFTSINGHRISVCVKFLSTENKTAVVHTLVRDTYSSSKRKTGNADKIKHLIQLNSDFDFIYNNIDNDDVGTGYYYKTKLPIRTDYKNSRLQSGWEPKFNIPLLNGMLRRKAWPLQYKSTLVVPIVPFNANQQNKYTLRGFLCIDSPREKSFYEQYDVNILKGICDGLYNKMDKLNELIGTD